MPIPSDRPGQPNRSREAPRGRTKSPPPAAPELGPPSSSSTRGAKSSGGVMAAGAAVVPILLLVLGLRFGSIVDFVQWDNLEVYLPWILSGHRRLLRGG